jgi:predicted MarR family transcription regulator
VTYEVTEEGLRVTEDYGALRRRLLLQAVANVPGFSERLAEATRTLNILSGIYEEISRVAATHRRG